MSFRAPPRQRFCTRSCAAKQPGAKVWASTADTSPAWKGGHRGYRGPGWPALRDRIRERDGWTCRDCGATRSDDVRLDVHHIVAADDWAAPGTANDPENLLTLCMDCHARKHWDGSWRGRRVSPELRDLRAAERRADSYQRDREKRIADATRWNRENRERRNARARERRAERRATG